MNSAAVARPELIGEIAARFGAQCVIASIDARYEAGTWRVLTHGGRRETALDAVVWARECVQRGAGEILLTSVDTDGGRRGFDTALLSAVTAVVRVPVIASGGAGEPAHAAEACAAGADAVLVAGVLHDGLHTVAEFKQAMAANGWPVRRTA